MLPPPPHKSARWQENELERLKLVGDGGYPHSPYLPLGSYSSNGRLALKCCRYMHKLITLVSICWKIHFTQENVIFKRKKKKKIIHNRTQLSNGPPRVETLSQCHLWAKAVNIDVDSLQTVWVSESAKWTGPVSVLLRCSRQCTLLIC